MLIDVTSYKNDYHFGWIIQELEIIEDTFKDYLNSGFELVNSKDKILEQKLDSIRNQDNSEDPMDSQIYYKRKLSNYYLERSFTYSGVSYLYSMLETKLLDIKKMSLFYLSDEFQKCIEVFECEKCTEVIEFLFNNRNTNFESIVKSLKSFYNLNFNKEVKENHKILCDFREIRNLIVHHDGILNEDFKNRQIIERQLINGLISNNVELTINQSYLIFIMSKIKVFLVQLMELIWENRK